MTNQEFELALAEMSEQARRERDEETMRSLGRIQEEIDRTLREQTELLAKINILKENIDKAMQ